nr:MAG TPA: hypothetical protein [Caudoviricetes sp.]
MNNMTDYVYVDNFSTIKPSEIDTTSSNVYVYQRKNIELVPEMKGDDGQTIAKHWRHQERKLNHDEYSRYLIAMEQVQAINEHSDNEAIDNYTMELMQEGII